MLETTDLTVDDLLLLLKPDQPLISYSKEAILTEMVRCLETMENGKLDVGELATHIPEQQLSEFVRVHLDGRIHYKTVWDCKQVVGLFESASACKALLNENPTLHYMHLRHLARRYKPEQRREALGVLLEAIEGAWSAKQLERELRERNQEPLHDEYRKLGDLFGCVELVQNQSGRVQITFSCEGDMDLSTLAGKEVKIGISVRND